MKLGLLITSIGNFGEKGFYNVQEIGLAKELDKLADEVIVYKLVSSNCEEKTEKLDGCRHVSINIIPSKSFGINGLFSTKLLDPNLDALIYFSDTQLMVPKVAKWAKKNRVKLYPYIGVTESHSANKLKKKVIDFSFKRNLNVYRNCRCFVKTPFVKDKLRKLNVTRVTVTPVGLDLSVLKSDYSVAEKSALKKKYGYKNHEKLILFIGRFVSEKQPDRMIDIFNEIYKQDDRFRLLMIGTGELQSLAKDKVNGLCLQKYIKFIDKIPNSDIWELYRISEAFVNLNQQEIFGMAILEAMYYECKVVAWHAPGPDYIIEDNKSGYLVNSNEEVIDEITHEGFNGILAHNRILSHFTWKHVAEVMINQIEEE